MFVPQFVLIGRDNERVGTPPDLKAARAALARGEAATLGGRLADGVYGADIDTDDPVLGDAAAEALVAWCVCQGLPYLVRESGRSGGRHVIVVRTHAKVKPSAWAKLCAKVTRQLAISVTDRTGQVLRLPTAPHRRGLSAPVVSCTITASTVLDRPAARATRRQGRSSARLGATGSPGTRSESEFGLSCALARAGYNTEAAWREVQSLGGKSADRGRNWWTRYMWVSAVSIAAAEDGLDESAAWQQARRACPPISRRWWAPVWKRARAEAKTDRPRRRRIASAAADAAQLQRIEDYRAGFAAAVAELPAMDPRFRKSVAAALHALSAPLVTRGGSVSDRDLSLRALLDKKTVRKALSYAIDHNLIIRNHEYKGGAKDCTGYELGPAVTITAQPSETSSPTRGTPHPCGTSNASRLRRTYHQERQRWRRRCDALASLAPGERLANSQHPAAKTLRSLHFQRIWWTSRTREQQETRRTERREVLAQLHHSQRSAWLDWLDTRADITRAADRLLAHRADLLDAQRLSTAPATIHRGLVGLPGGIDSQPARIQPPQLSLVPG
ncbi:hypothetical protein [Nocardia cyriacigeorgica]|uniref:Uncharacterized protein n=1 Tax=Nocardia cyriacigeorgica TaxID=135487 RepID=A0A6P1DHU9_9NOCA|nr:hypothetical protein [Nocardia cyriacigeorgica]NEW42519.1 hypothetical protein [Nocardia cyriacigeorgica]NEW47972.1 hypothetical protein [Nocardia cyriacigeorgica]